MGIAQKLADNQKQVAISEFFEKNKHFLGFDSLARSLITAVKESVDNSLDACEEARMLPTLKIQINKIKSIIKDSEHSDINGFKKILYFMLDQETKEKFNNLNE